MLWQETDCCGYSGQTVCEQPAELCMCNCLQFTATSALQTARLLLDILSFMCLACSPAYIIRTVTTGGLIYLHAKVGAFAPKLCTSAVQLFPLKVWSKALVRERGFCFGTSVFPCLEMILMHWEHSGDVSGFIPELLNFGCFSLPSISSQRIQEKPEECTKILELHVFLLCLDTHYILIFFPSFFAFLKQLQ